jgi:uncharacterized protein
MSDIDPLNESQQELTPDERNWGMLCHLSIFSGLLIPLANIIAPLIIWLIKRDEMPFVNHNGKEALNFQITYLIAFIVSSALTTVLIGFLMLAVLVPAWVILTIIATVKASKGEYYRYPLILRLIN